jgi:hypothetical protein
MFYMQTNKMLAVEDSNYERSDKIIRLSMFRNTVELL